VIRRIRDEGGSTMDKNRGGYYQSLYEIAAAMNSIRVPEDVLRSIVENVTKAMGAKGCSLMLLTPDRKLLLHTAAYGLSDWYVRKGPLSADKSISEALEGKPVAVLDAAEDPRIQYREQARKEGIVSILSVPMMLKEETIGVIRVYSNEPRHFTMDDMYFVGAVANLGAIALENARLNESVRKDYEALRLDISEWRAALGWEWMAGESVIPIREKGPTIMAGG
jgi:signal transduction protein with GAF and PtsI domain